MFTTALPTGRPGRRVVRRLQHRAAAGQRHPHRELARAPSPRRRLRPPSPRSPAPASTRWTPYARPARASPSSRAATSAASRSRSAKSSGKLSITQTIRGSGWCCAQLREALPAGPPRRPPPGGCTSAVNWSSRSRTYSRSAAIAAARTCGTQERSRSVCRNSTKDSPSPRSTRYSASSSGPYRAARPSSAVVRNADRPGAGPAADQPVRGQLGEAERHRPAAGVADRGGQPVGRARTPTAVPVGGSRSARASREPASTCAASRRQTASTSSAGGSASTKTGEFSPPGGSAPGPREGRCPAGRRAARTRCAAPAGWPAATAAGPRTGPAAASRRPPGAARRRAPARPAPRSAPDRSAPVGSGSAATTSSSVRSCRRRPLAPGGDPLLRLGQHRPQPGHVHRRWRQQPGVGQRRERREGAAAPVARPPRGPAAHPAGAAASSRSSTARSSPATRAPGRRRRRSGDRCRAAAPARGSGRRPAAPRCRPGRRAAGRRRPGCPRVQRLQGGARPAGGQRAPRRCAAGRPARTAGGGRPGPGRVSSRMPAAAVAVAAARRCRAAARLVRAFGPATASTPSSRGWQPLPEQ